MASWKAPIREFLNETSTDLDKVLKARNGRSSRSNSKTAKLGLSTTPPGSPLPSAALGPVLNASPSATTPPTNTHSTGETKSNMSEIVLPPFWKRTIEVETLVTTYVHDKTQVTTTDDPNLLTCYLICSEKVGVGCRKTAVIGDRISKCEDEKTNVRYLEPVIGTLTADGNWLCMDDPENKQRHGSFIPLRFNDEPDYFKPFPLMTKLLIGATIKFEHALSKAGVMCEIGHPLVEHTTTSRGTCDICYNTLSSGSTVMQCAAGCNYWQCELCRGESGKAIAKQFHIGVITDFVKKGKFAGSYKVQHLNKKINYFQIGDNSLPVDILTENLPALQRFQCSIQYATDMKVRVRWKSLKGKYYK
jgi:hypothetical protein